MVDAEDVDLPEGLEVLGRGLPQGRSAGQHRRGGDHGVQPAPPVDRLLRGAVQGGGVAYVGDDGHHPLLAGGERGQVVTGGQVVADPGHSVTAAGTRVQGEYGVPVRTQSSHGGGADAPGRSGDQRDGVLHRARRTR